MSFSDWSTTSASNALVLGTNIGEGCPPGNVNDAIRKLMADIRAAIDPTLEAFLSSTSLAQARSALGVPEDDQTGLVPAGAISLFGGSVAPSEWLECDGSAVSRSVYSDLFSAIGTTHGSGDGSTTFNLPDLRGEFVRGWDHGRGVDTGRAFASAQSDDLKAHTHGLRVYDRADTDTLGSGGAGDNTVSASSAYISGYVESTGGSETRPRNKALLYIIKT